MNFLLFNPLSHNGQGEIFKNKALEELREMFPSLETTSVIGLDYDTFLAKLNSDDNVVIVGGDGTIMRFVNILKTNVAPCAFYLYRGGTGNDFLHDVLDDNTKNIVKINDYIKNLPVIKVDGKSYKFINGIGYGLDGTACEVAEQKKALGQTEINYAGISVGLMLNGYKCPNAKVTIDGVTKEYKKVWLASVMNGRYYGGGLMISPDQDRNGDKVTCVLFHGSSKLRTLMIFPKIFKGKHVKYTKYIDIVSGHQVKIEFDAPNALQIDGETILGINSYEVSKK